ncbi:MAG: hypothetical protein K8R54_07455 [Bacteroidales bacterium]|nr:hypothetical protein [Bacteroidales bacterium]
MKTKILLLIIVTLAIACNSQEKKDMKNKVIIFKDYIFDLDDLKLLSNIDGEIDTAKLNIVWNINNEPNNFSDAKDTIIIADKTGKEFQVSISETIIDNTISNYIIELKDKKLKKTLWKYSPNQALSLGTAVKAVVNNNKLIIAAYCPIVSGSDLVCIDIYSGKEIWRGEIKQLYINHSQYSNSVYIKLFGDKIVMAGDEAGCSYIQIIDINTGANLFTKMENNWDNSSEKEYSNNPFLCPECGEKIMDIFKKTKQIQNLYAEDIDFIACNKYEVIDENKKIYIRTCCDFRLFPDEIKNGFPLIDFSKKLYLKEWINDENFEIITGIAGKIPVKLIAGNSSVVLRISDDFPPKSVTVYLRISKETDKQEFLQLIKEKSIKDIEVLEAVLIIESGIK